MLQTGVHGRAGSQMESARQAAIDKRAGETNFKRANQNGEKRRWRATVGKQSVICGMTRESRYRWLATRSDDDTGSRAITEGNGARSEKLFEERERTDRLPSSSLPIML